ncbi:hypothetical protein E2C01_075097 [Portunus trituberculatus]|uniref:Uncharacterized protein n=1 Tax=Portunus trituberculatus TaxID=210409 RepID=A0A5B7IG02_PORTR|nr:hypothetical protein [Portunus trituberculatus]
MTLPAVWSCVFGVGAQSGGYEAVFGRSCCRVPPAIPPAIHHASVGPCPPSPDKKSVTHRFFCHSFQNDTNCRAAHKKLRNKKGREGGSNTNVVNRRGCRRASLKASERGIGLGDSGAGKALRHPARRVLRRPGKNVFNRATVGFTFRYTGLAGTSEELAALPLKLLLLITGHICFLLEPQNVKGKRKKK